jgi:hypothetical protein
MIRLARRASLLLAFYLLASAATAYTECAWVLWVEQPSGSNQWNLSTAIEFMFDTKTKCDQAAAAALDARISEVERQEKVLGRRLDAPKFFKCLPDTVDPRGPRK